MRIFLVGATGLLGRPLCRRLVADGHEVTAWVRDPVRAAKALGDGAAFADAATGHAGLVAGVSSCDAIVNLAGEPVLQRWTDANRAKIVDSRQGLNERICKALAAATSRPSTWIQASAIGYFGDRGDVELDEGSPRGSGFLADVCDGWERSTDPAAALGVRVCCVRIGIVLAKEGGALAQMLPTARLGLGAALGSGKQWLSWIHIDDMVELLVFALGNPRAAGPMIATAPNPVRQHELAVALGRALRRPVMPRWLGVPSLGLEVAYGEAASAILGSQRALPRAAMALGFRFAHAHVDEALASLV
jgi:hypothetical protein